MTRYGILIDDFRTLNQGHWSMVRDIEFYGSKCLILCYNDDGKTYREPGYYRYRRVKRYYQDDPRVFVYYLGAVAKDRTNLDELKEKFETIWNEVTIDEFFPLSAKDKGRTWILPKDTKLKGILENFGEQYEIAPYETNRLTLDIELKPQGYFGELAPTFYDLFGENILILGSQFGEKDLIARKIGEALSSPVGINAMREIKKQTETPYNEFNQSAFESAINLQFKQNVIKADSLSNWGLFISTGGVLPILSYAAYASQQKDHYLTPEMYEDLKCRIQPELIPNWSRIYILNDTSYKWEEKLQEKTVEILKEYGFDEDEVIFRVQSTTVKGAFEEITEDIKELTGWTWWKV